MDAVILLTGSQIIHSSYVAMGTGSYPSGETCGWGVNVMWGHWGPLISLMASSGSWISLEGPSPVPSTAQALPPICVHTLGCQFRDTWLGQCEPGAPGESEPGGVAHPLLQPRLEREALSPDSDGPSTAASGLRASGVSGSYSSGFALGLYLSHRCV